MPDANLEKLQAVARQNWNQDLNGALKAATGQQQDMEGICKNLFGESCNKHFIELKTLLGGNGAFFNGTAGAYWESADKAAFDIVGDIDIRAEVDQVVSGAVNRTILSKWLPASQQSYEWRYNGFGFDELVWSVTAAGAASTDTLAINSGIVAIRVTMDVDDLSGNRVITWYSSSNDRIDGTWTARPGSPKTTAGVTSIFSGTAPLRIGTRSDGTNPFNGRIRRLELRNGINGTVVANPDFRFQGTSTTNFVDAAGNTWTAAGGAVIA
jgi:hypothetical protein